MIRDCIGERASEVQAMAYISDSVKRRQAMTSESQKQAEDMQMLANDLHFKHITSIEFRSGFIKAIMSANEEVLESLAASLF